MCVVLSPCPFEEEGTELIHFINPLIPTECTLDWPGIYINSFQYFNVTGPAGSAGGTPPHSIRITRIYRDSFDARSRCRQRKLCECVSAGIEAGELVGLIFTDPNQVVLSINVDGVDAGKLRRRLILLNLSGAAVDADQFVRLLRRGPNVTVCV